MTILILVTGTGPHHLPYALFDFLPDAGGLCYPLAFALRLSPIQ